VNWRGEIANADLKEGEFHIELTSAPAYCELGLSNVRTAQEQ
jgi:hypothetical protein